MYHCILLSVLSVRNSILWNRYLHECWPRYLPCFSVRSNWLLSIVDMLTWLCLPELMVLHTQLIHSGHHGVIWLWYHKPDTYDKLKGSRPNYLSRPLFYWLWCDTQITYFDIWDTQQMVADGVVLMWRQVICSPHADQQRLRWSPQWPVCLLTLACVPTDRQFGTAMVWWKSPRRMHAVGYSTVTDKYHWLAEVHVSRVLNRVEVPRRVLRSSLFYICGLDS